MKRLLFVSLAVLSLMPAISLASVPTPEGTGPGQWSWPPRV